MNERLEKGACDVSCSYSQYNFPLIEWLASGVQLVNGLQYLLCPPVTFCLLTEQLKQAIKHFVIDIQPLIFILAAPVNHLTNR